MPEQTPLHDTKAFDRWDQFLLELELDIASVGTRDERDVPEFVSPSDLGVLPKHLEARARTIVAAHTELVERMRQEQAQVGRHLYALRAVPHDPADALPVYIDAAG